MEYNCLIAQSGGPTSAINATLAGIYSAADKNSAVNKIYGGLNGIEGIIKGKIVPQILPAAAVTIDRPCGCTLRYGYVHLEFFMEKRLFFLFGVSFF